ncbi:undecaprenyl-diphosphatase [Sphingomonas jinjuensis]|uniref:Undecaprenyl-diphosphatase n=1 Tax=Sphingomonas jinjuensis TaxID=535907 RepID=A0A840FIS2_9SPHN|nr:phosphatase PAP2 family protein [Sphingomonas jinjuensis]MBB4153245.1 undecaprenyl-diphosphatase [Sphingomonas jinjuensis]
MKTEAKTLAKRAARADRRHAHRATEHEDGLALRLAGKASDLADQPPLIALSIATFGGGLVLRHGALARAGARMLASHLLATAAKTVLKNAIDRTRPARAVMEGYRLEKGDGADDPSLNSFPSGHTAGAVAVAEAIAAELPGAALPARLVAAGVGLVQPHRGKHYLSDVAAGAVIGWVSAWAVDTVWRAAADKIKR